MAVLGIDSLHAIKDYIDESKLIKLTYEELVNLRDENKLIPGCFYQITDYETTTVQLDTKSAGHKFDVIVLATSNNTLSEDAYATYHFNDDGTGDGYFLQTEDEIVGANWITPMPSIDDVNVLYTISYEDTEEEYGAKPSSKVVTELLTFENQDGITVPAMLNPAPGGDSSDDCYYVYCGTANLSEVTNDLVQIQYTIAFGNEVEYDTDDLANTSRIISDIGYRQRIVSASFKEGVTIDSITEKYKIIPSDSDDGDGGTDYSVPSEESDFITALETIENEDGIIVPSLRSEMPNEEETGPSGVADSLNYVGKFNFNDSVYDLWEQCWYDSYNPTRTNSYVYIITNEIVDAEFEDVPCFYTRNLENDYPDDVDYAQPFAYAGNFQLVESATNSLVYPVYVMSYDEITYTGSKWHDGHDIICKIDYENNTPIMYKTDAYKYDVHDEIDYEEKFVYEDDFTITTLRNQYAWAVYTLNTEDEIAYDDNMHDGYKINDVFVKIDYREVDGVSTPVMYKEDISEYGEDSYDSEDLFVYAGNFEVGDVVYNRWKKYGHNVMDAQDYSGYDVLTPIIVVDNQFIMTQEEFKAGITEIPVGTYNRWKKYEQDTETEYEILTPIVVVNNEFIITQQEVEDAITIVKLPVYNRWKKYNWAIGNTNIEYSQHDVLTQIIVEDGDFNISREEFLTHVYEHTVTYDKWQNYWINREDDGTHWDNYYRLTNHLVDAVINRKVTKIANLDAWKIKYCLDNDTDRFAWACKKHQRITNLDVSHGVEPLIRNPKYDNTNVLYGTNDYQYAWTGASFSGDYNNGDLVYSLNEVIQNDENVYWPDGNTYVQVEVDVVPDGKGVIYQMIDEYNNEAPYDFKNIMYHSNNSDYYTFDYINADNEKLDLSLTEYSNTLSSIPRAIGCHNNVIKPYYNQANSNDNEGYGRTQYLNNIYFKNDSGVYCCYSNFFDYGCRNIHLDSCCSLNSFGKDCRDITFGSKCNYNKFGDNCYNNTFDDNCYYNTFGDDCETNAFGNICYYNTFGSSCRSNTFGDDCSHNTFGNTCTHNTFGDSSSAISNCQYNIIDNGCEYLYIVGNETSGYLQNIHIHSGVKGTDESNRKTIIVNRGLDYTTDVYSEGSTEMFI